MVDGRLDQRAPAQIVNPSRQDLSARRARSTNCEIRKHAQHGIIRGVKQRIKALRAALRSGRLTIRPLPFPGGTRRAVIHLVAPAAQSPQESEQRAQKVPRREALG